MVVVENAIWAERMDSTMNARDAFSLTMLDMLLDDGLYRNLNISTERQISTVRGRFCTQPYSLKACS